jgi:hypothetical protein
MNQRTDTPTASTTPTAYGRCHWCKTFAAGVRLVDVIEQGSGPGTAGNLFACTPCRETHGLVPLADR